VGLVDTHCHLDFEQFDVDRDAVLERAVAAGVTTLVNPAADIASSRRAVALAERCERVFAAVGVHPHEAATLDGAAMAELRHLAAHSRVIAIGEIGLDYYRDLSPRRQQMAAFEAQLDLAADLGLPVIVHQREAAEDVLAVLRGWRSRSTGRPGGVLHAFSGDMAMAREAIELGFGIGVAGPVTFTNARQLPDIVPQLPLDWLVIETDAPYLTPHPHRGRRNEPAYLPLVAHRVADLLGLKPDQLAARLAENAHRLLHVPATEEQR
jgi:TatD DNase family protein